MREGCVAAESRSVLGIVAARLGRSFGLVCMLLLPSGVVVAQIPRAPELPAERLQRLAAAGNTTDARVLADSLLASATEGSIEQADALYWRAVLSDDLAQARRDFLRLAEEFPRDPRTEDALLRLAQIELAHGERSVARRYLERLKLEHPGGRKVAQASYWLGRVLLEQGEMGGACAALAEAATQGTDIELANQIGYYARQCKARPTIGAGVDSVLRADSLRVRQAELGGKVQVVDSARRKTEASADREHGGARIVGTRPAASSRQGEWSAQVAAYPSRAGAVALAAKLTRRGYETRVTSSAPFRVRIGRFATHAAATAYVEALHARNVTAIVVVAEAK